MVGYRKRDATLGGSKVKSARRVLQVLEYFDETRSDASVMDVARALNMPQSSTTELLHCLSHMGYLSYDPHRRPRWSRRAPPHAGVVAHIAGLAPNIVVHAGAISAAMLAQDDP